MCFPPLSSVSGIEMPYVYVCQYVFIDGKKWFECVNVVQVLHIKNMSMCWSLCVTSAACPRCSIDVFICMSHIFHHLAGQVLHQYWWSLCTHVIKTQAHRHTHTGIHPGFQAFSHLKECKWLCLFFFFNSKHSSKTLKWFSVQCLSQLLCGYYHYLLAVPAFSCCATTTKQKSLQPFLLSLGAVVHRASVAACTVCVYKDIWLVKKKRLVGIKNNQMTDHQQVWPSLWKLWFSQC